MKDRLKQSLVNLTSLPALSGFEQPVVKYLKDYLSQYVDSIEVDTMGNLYARKRGSKQGPRIMVIAHTDEVGFIVKSIDSNGFLYIQPVGVVNIHGAFGRKVIVNNKYLGVMGTRPAHLIGNDTKNAWTEIYVDIGASSKDEVLNMGVNIGDPITYKEGVDTFNNPDIVFGSSIDNRAGCAALISLIENMDSNFSGELIAVFSAQEEIGYRGARVAAYTVNPDCAIVVDTVPAGDTPDVNTEKELPICISKGPGLTLASGNIHEGHIAHPYLKKMLIGICQQLNIPFQPVTRLGPSTNDASFVHLTRNGIPVASVTIPRRYSHSPVEVMNLNDLEQVVRILIEVFKNSEMLKNISFLN